MAAETATVKLSSPLPEAPEIRDDESFSEVARKLSLYVSSSLTHLPSPLHPIFISISPEWGGNASRVDREPHGSRLLPC